MVYPAMPGAVSPAPAPYTLQPQSVTPHPMQQCAPSAYSPCMPGALMPSTSMQPQSPSIVAQHILSLVQAPPQPQLHVANAGSAITVEWQSSGSLAASYLIEVREGTSSASNLFTRLAPDAADSLELCIQGLEP